MALKTVSPTSQLLLILSLWMSTEAFVVRQSNVARPISSSQLQFGIPDMFLPKPGKDDDNEKKEEKKIGLAGVVQLITAGMGAPFLGEFEGVDEESGKYLFSLEANNLVDEEGKSKQTQMPYFQDGWVDPEDEGFKFPWQK